MSATEGQTPEKPSPQAPPEAAWRKAPSTSASTAGSAEQRAGLVFRLLEELNAGYAFERSFRISHRVLLANRFLLGIHKRSAAPEIRETILGICRRMGMPEHFRAIVGEQLPAAELVHFGFEENESGCTYKVYLEFAPEMNRPLTGSSGRPDPVLLFLGLKWDANDSAKCALTRYAWRPGLSFEEMLRRVRRSYDGGLYSRAPEITRDVLAVASGKIGPEEVFFLEVTNDNTQRRSFDVNVYKAGLRMRDLHLMLLAMRRHYGIADEQFRAVYEPIRSERFGHLSGGVHANGRDFLTVYFGVKGRRGRAARTVAGEGR